MPTCHLDGLAAGADAHNVSSVSSVSSVPGAKDLTMHQRYKDPTGLVHVIAWWSYFPQNIGDIYKDATGRFSQPVRWVRHCHMACTLYFPATRFTRAADVTNQTVPSCLGCLAFGRGARTMRKKHPRTGRRI